MRVMSTSWTLGAARGRPSEAVAAAVLLLPAIAIAVLFQYLPIADVVGRSFYDFNPFTRQAADFVYLDNYAAIFGDTIFRRAAANTALYIAIVVVGETVLAIALALLIHARLQGSWLLRSAMIAAMAASEPITALIWAQMYEPSFGLLNTFLTSLGFAPQAFLADTSTALPSIAVMTIWRGVGLPTLVLLAGLQTIPSSLYEAAALDGAGPFARFRHVTLPLLRPSLVVAMFMSTLHGARIFTPISIMTDGGPSGSSMNLIYYAYQEAFKFQADGTAAACAVITLVGLALLAFAQNRLVERSRRP